MNSFETYRSDKFKRQSHSSKFKNGKCSKETQISQQNYSKTKTHSKKPYVAHQANEKQSKETQKHKTPHATDSSDS